MWHRIRQLQWSAIVVGMALCAIPLTAQRTQVASGAASDVEARVTVHLDNVRLQDALKTIGQAARVDVTFSATTIPADRRVTISVEDVLVSEAIRQVLAGTDIRITRVGGRFVLYREDALQQGEGTIHGRIVDQRNQAAVRGATIAIDGVTKTVTREDGSFQVTKLSLAAHAVTIRVLGYTSAKRIVTLDSATPSATLNVALEATPTTLTEVVTTGAGDRKRVEVGNTIATINADSVVRTTPIRNLSDLLAARVPGVDVLATSGQVGSPSTILIRGAGSISSTTDPIVIVDGIRVNGGHKTGFMDYNNNPLVGNAPTMSPLNDIDPQTIESIDILRGPSASAMYGSDAANGVIVIKTKRGSAGPTRWNFFGSSATTHLATSFPDNYFGWGQGTANTVSGECTLSNPIFLPSVATGTCTMDSVTHFTPLNDKDTSPLAHGNDTQYGGDVSGGTERLQYFLGANYENNVGMLKLPALDYQALAKFQPGRALSDWQQRPNVENGMHVDTRVTSHVSETADLSFSASALHQYHRGVYALNGFIGQAASLPGYRDTVTYGWGYIGATPASAFSTLTSDVTDRMFGNLSGTWHPWRWLNGRGTLGADHASQATEFFRPRGALNGQPDGDAGQISEGTATTRLYSGDFGAETSIPLSSRIQWRSSLGTQFNKTQFDRIGITGQGLAYGSNTTQGATTTFPDEDHAASATMGWYVETGLSVVERLFATVSVRSDQGSAFSSSGGGARFPKFNLSWLVSQEPVFQHTLGQWLPISNLRLRAAYGQAGVQPDIQARYRTYGPRTGNVDGSPALVSILNSLGNSSLVPERSVETEGGFDLSLWNDRLTVEATAYRKMTRNALVDPGLPPSFGNFSYTTNLGRVSNRGVELTMAAQPIVSALATWNVTLTYSTNSNKLLSGNDGTFANFGTQRYVQGYPLFGFWARPIFGYADVNHDGLIVPSEIQLGDSAVYLGAPYPKADIALHQTVSLFSGQLSLGMGLDIRQHFTQYNSAATRCTLYCQGVVDPSASFAEQVRAQEAIIGTFFFGSGTPSPFIETVSWARLNELSLTYVLPPRVTRVLRTRNASVSVMGRNLGLWTKYRGADPEVNTNSFSTGKEIEDAGGMPQPREWRLRLNLGF